MEENNIPYFSLGEKDTFEMPDGRRVTVDWKDPESCLAVAQEDMIVIVRIISYISKLNVLSAEYQEMVKKIKSNPVRKGMMKAAQQRLREAFDAIEAIKMEEAKEIQVATDRVKEAKTNLKY